MIDEQGGSRCGAHLKKLCRLTSWGGGVPITIFSPLVLVYRYWGEPVSFRCAAHTQQSGHSQQGSDLCVLYPKGCHPNRNGPKRKKPCGRGAQDIRQPNFRGGVGRGTSSSVLAHREVREELSHALIADACGSCWLIAGP
jgi:hypothetical protein